jgi:hypothetical protein
MSLIRQVLLASSGFYALLFIIQTIERPPVLGESVFGIAIVAFLSLLSTKTDKDVLHRGEILLLWTGILLFALYALLKAVGII